MHTLFYFNKSELAGNLEGMIDEGTYKTTIHNMHKLGQKAKFFKSSDVSMLGHGCSVSQYPQFYDTIKQIKCYHIHIWGNIQAKRVTNSCANHEFLHQPNQMKFLLVSISYMPTIKYWQNWENIMDKANVKILK